MKIVSSVRKLNKPSSKYLLSNIFYSFSTYLINLTLPYVLVIESYAEYITLFQIMFTLTFVFEFGITTSYLTYDRDSRDKLFSVLQLFILASIITCYVFNDHIVVLLNISSIRISKEIFWGVIITQVFWVFFRTRLLAGGRLITLNLHAFSILGLRIFLVLLLIADIIKPGLNEILFYCYLLPFITLTALQFIKVFQIIRHSSFTGGLIQLKNFLSRSVINYVSGLFYLVAIRFVFIYFAETDKDLLALLGFSYSFIGILNVFYFSARTYLVSKFQMNNIKEVEKYSSKLSKNKVVYLVIPLLSFVISYVVYLIKPGYLGLDLLLVTFVVIFTFTWIYYLGLFNLLSKTFNLLKVDTALNLARLSVSIAIVVFIFSINVYLGIILLHMNFLLFEVILKIILNRKIGLIRHAEMV